MANTSNMPSYWTLRRKAKERVDRNLALLSSDNRTVPSLAEAVSSSIAEYSEDTFMECQPEDQELRCEDSDHMSDVFFDACESFVSDDDLETSDDEDCDHLRRSLANWAGEHQIPHAALNDLLKLLTPYHSSLPRDSRTLLGTVRSVDVSEKAGGQYHYFGVLNAIKAVLNANKAQLQQHMCLNLQTNIDGLPLFKSSSTQLWPILGRVQNFQGDPVVLGLFCGTTKPKSIHEFLEDFVNEIRQLEGGFDFEGLRLTLKLSSMVCDAPACAFIKNIKGHTGYFGCGKCTQEGVYTDNRICYPDIHAPLRTDEDFEQMVDEEHHLGPSPLQQTSLGMVSGFPLDYMHLICLGVMRKLFMLWLKGPLTCRLSSQNIAKLSQRLTDARSHVPLEFSRRPRALRELDRWKATEFRQFLLYTGPVLLKGILNNAIYHNFLLLSVGIHILINSRLTEDCTEYANALLTSFVQHFGELYGKKYISYNVHNVTHLVEDVKRHGVLDNFSTFQYETFLHRLKRLVRKPQSPLSQIIRRLSETPLWQTCNKNRALELKKQHLSGPIPESFRGLEVAQFSEVRTNRFTIKLDQANRFVSSGGSVVRVDNIITYRGETFIVFSKLADQGTFFDYPLPSTTLGIRVVDLPVVCEPTDMCKIECMDDKLFLVPFEGKFVSIPLLH